LSNRVFVAVSVSAVEGAFVADCTESDEGLTVLLVVEALDSPVEGSAILLASYVDTYNDVDAPIELVVKLMTSLSV
jgi:hypothetical protein